MGDSKSAVARQASSTRDKVIMGRCVRGPGRAAAGEPSLPAYLTVKQACEIASIGRTTFYKLLDNPRSGLEELTVRIPGLGHIRIPERDFRRWLESSRTKRAGGKTKKPT